MGRIVYTKKHTTSKIYQHEQKRIFGAFHFFLITSTTLGLS